MTAGKYLVSITKISSDCEQLSTEVLLITNNYILGITKETTVFSISLA